MEKDTTCTINATKRYACRCDKSYRVYDTPAFNTKPVVPLTYIVVIEELQKMGRLCIRGIR